MTYAVVTGAAGFIGSHITDELLRRGYIVTGIDDMSTGRLYNIRHLLANDKFTMVRGSITDKWLLLRLLKGADTVFHQAALSSVPMGIARPVKTNEVNVNGTLNMLMAARSNNVRRVVFASSASVYGDTAVLPNREDMATDPQSPYAVSKLAGEKYCRAFEKVYGLKTVCLRYFNVYGPRQDPDSQYSAVIPKLVRSTMLGEPFTVYGDGEQSRDFVYIDDVVKANMLAADDSFPTGIYNISRGEAVTLNAVIGIVRSYIGNGLAEIVYGDGKEGGIKHSLADIAKAKALGYEPQYDIKEGLVKTIDSMRRS